MINPLLAPISPENFVRDLGLSEILLYSEDTSDSPDFSSSDIHNIIRVTNYNLMPKQKTEAIPTIHGLPDKSLFETKMVEIDGSIELEFGTTIYNTLEYPIGRLFEHLRNSFSGLTNSGSIISPRDDLISLTPWFSLGSTYHGSFIQCLVNSLSINMSSAEDPIKLSLGIVSTQYNAQSAFTYQGLRTITSLPEFKRGRQVLHGHDLYIETDETGVTGHFGMPDASNSPFAKGPNKPSSPDYITKFSIEINNNLKPLYTAHSHELIDYRERYAENMFPHAYGYDGQRSISGSISWWGNSTPLTFCQKITGPSSVQGKKSIIVNVGAMKFEITDPIWNLPDAPHQLSIMERTANFSAVSDGLIIIPQYDADFA